MSDLKGITAVTINAFYYQDVRRCIEAAIELAGAIGDLRSPRSGGVVQFEFNTVTVTVRMDSDLDQIEQKYRSDLDDTGLIRSVG